jgi:hypothetical protein
MTASRAVAAALKSLPAGAPTPDVIRAALKEAQNR